MPAAFAGIDLGTSAVKVLATTASGEVVASASESYGLHTPRDGFVEQDADEVCAAAHRSLAAVTAAARARDYDVVAVGLASAMHGVLCVDERGEPISAVITWMDRRAQGIAQGWRDDGTAAALYPTTGAPMHPMLPIAKLRWLAEHDPALFARAHRFVGIKELLVHRWTGAWLVDHGIASATGMFDLRAHSWDPRAVALTGVGPERLSQPALPSTRTRVQRTFARDAGLADDARLVIGSSDGALANIGLGATDSDVAVTLGTSGAVRVLRSDALLDADARTFCYCADDARFIVGGPISGAGAALEWLFALLFDDVPHEGRFDRAVEAATHVAPGADGALVLPFFGGERAPYWNGELRGTLDGLDLTHDRRTIARAAFEGVAFGIRAVYDIVRAQSPDAERLLLSGGLTGAPFIRALLADVCRTPATRFKRAEAVAFGAALLAAHAVGAIDDPIATARHAGYEPPVIPDAERCAAYDAAYARYRAAVEAQLARLRQPHH